MQCDKFYLYFCVIEANMSLDFLDTILGCLSKSTEKESFAIQNTLYALCILLNASNDSDACYSKGYIAIDDETYDATKHIFPPTLIADYGFWKGSEGYCLQTSTDIFWPFITIMLDNDSDLIKIINERIEKAFEQKPEWNYYGSVIDTAELSVEWLARANSLFNIKQQEQKRQQSFIVPLAQAPILVASDMMLLHKSALKHTRRVHGRRALTPPRASRPTAVTRNSKTKHR